MKKIILKLLKGLGITSLVMAALMLLGVVLINTRYVQNRLMKWATESLSEKLHTHISIDSVSIDIFSLDVLLYGVDIEDRQQRKMLEVRKLSADIKLWPLFRKKVVVNSLEVTGMKAVLIKPSEEQPANYQFLIDAFKKKKHPDEKKKKHEPFTADIAHVKLNDVDVFYNSTQFGFHQAAYDRRQHGRHAFSVDSLHIKTDNGKPRKNTGKPHRGFFDTGHLDLNINLSVNIDSLGKDTVIADITRCEASDAITGIDINALTATIHANKRQAQLTNLVVRQKHTVVNVSSADVQLPDKKEGRRLAFSTGIITGRTYLKDISRAFAPALRKFSIPLNFQTRMDGNGNGMRFHGIKVHTDGSQLTVKGTGNITRLREKRNFSIIFRISSMNANVGIIEKIINQFSVKKLMMGQLRKLGKVAYNGYFHVGWKTVDFHGLLHTGAGSVNFSFAIDGLNKYLTGNVHTSSFALGKVMNLPNIGDLACSAQFKIDISKPRTALMRKQKGGKLPIGTVTANVDDCSYKKTHVHNITANIESDGAEAVGSIVHSGKLIDLSCDFSFTDTDAMHKMKIRHPGLKLHKMTEEEKQKKQALKEEKKAEKAKNKAEKQALKEQKKAEKQALKEQKKAEKAQRKAEKQKEKEQAAQNKITL